MMKTLTEAKELTPGTPFYLDGIERIVHKVETVTPGPDDALAYDGFQGGTLPFTRIWFGARSGKTWGSKDFPPNWAVYAGEGL